MTINTNVISIFVSSQPGDSASLQGGLSVQILPSISYLPGCLKHQFAAFIRDRGILVVWDDNPDKIIEHTTRLETLLMETIWNNGANYADEEKELTTEQIDEITSLENMEEGRVQEERRPLMFISPTIVAGTMILIFSCLGLGWRKLALEVAVDGNYIRLGLALFSPLLFFVGLVCFSITIHFLVLTFLVLNAVDHQLFIPNLGAGEPTHGKQQSIFGKTAKTNHNWTTSSHNHPDACVQGGSEWGYQTDYNVNQRCNVNI
jgi:hypothetical protein